MLLKTLGGLALEGTQLQRPKPLLLLAYLALEGPKDRRYLSELFWQGAEEPMTSLRMTLSRIRQQAPSVIETRKELVKVNIQADAVTLLEALERGELSAISSYAGPFLSGFYLPDLGAELEEWIYTTREFLAERVREVLLRQAEAVAAEGDFRAAAKHAEEAYGLAAAPAPEPELLERLYPLLLAGDSLLADKIRMEARDYDLVLNLNGDEARARFFTPEKKEQTAKVQVTLPSTTTSFIGRDPELLELAELLAEPDLRLITITGAGGVGKTRLALQVAYEQTQTGSFADGVYFVPLETLSDVNAVPAAIAKALALQLPEREDSLEELSHALQDQHLLLVLDNFEQLTSGATLLSSLLKRCTKLKLLVTSRERLQLTEEQVFPLGGLSLSQKFSPPQNSSPSQNSSEALNQDAVKLFVHRAKRAWPEFEPEKYTPQLVNICERLEGFPLAIELAAAWVRLMSPEEIVRELENPDFLETPARNVSDRHRSLRATFEHSWKLLSEKERTVLKQLSVFAGSFSRDGASAVAGASIPVLASLVDKSLLRVLPNFRYERHPLLSQYGQEKLAEHPSEKAQAEARHTSYFLELARLAEAELEGAKQTTYLDQLEVEHDNFRAVLARSLIEGGNANVGLELAGRLWLFWELRGHFREGRTWLKALLARTEGRTALRAKGLNSAALLAFEVGDLAVARELFETSLAIYRELGPEHQLAVGLSLNNLAMLAVRQRDPDFDVARAYYEESLAIFQTLGDRQRVALNFINLGILLYELADFAAARLKFQESLAIYRDIGSPMPIAQCTLNLGVVDIELGQYDRAKMLLEEGLATLEKVGDKHRIGIALSSLGLVALKAGDYSLAASHYRASLLMQQELGDKKRIAECLTGLAAVAIKQHHFQEAARLLAAVEALLETIGGRLDLAERTLYDESLSNLQQTLGQHLFANVWTEGRMLSLNGVVDLALASIEGSPQVNPAD
jgi:predicted ATPase